MFETVNKELHYVNEWFMANKLFLNEGKTKNLFFNKQRSRDSIPLMLPTVTFNSTKITRESFTKFLGASIDEYITWNKHVELL